MDLSTMHRAREIARKSQRSLMSELVEITGREPRDLVHALAGPFGIQVVETADMLGCSPAFDLLPLPKAPLCAAA
jgi:general secretion pathway protein E